MWRKIGFTLVLGLALNPPSSAMAALDSFSGLVEGIASSLATSGLGLESAHDINHTQGGNVIIGTGGHQTLGQQATITGDTNATMSTSDRGDQGVNVMKVKSGDERPVLMIQDTVISGKAAMGSNSSSNSNQGVNLITHCDAGECQ
ncbi:hypothetical protein VU07_01010 [Desulfobulbus sp. F4]|nr:hypothetical protein [Desulfobulbus sp. F3]MCW5200386.1 hypothetical protein [Desulfobulbus sp. F4]